MYVTVAQGPHFSSSLVFFHRHKVLIDYQMLSCWPLICSKSNRTPVLSVSYFIEDFVKEKARTAWSLRIVSLVSHPQSANGAAWPLGQSDSMFHEASFLPSLKENTLWTNVWGSRDNRWWKPFLVGPFARTCWQSGPELHLFTNHH